MSTLQRHQLLPAKTISGADLVDEKGQFDAEKSAKMIRLVYETSGKAFQDLLRLVDLDPRMSDTRIAHGVTTQQGDVIFDYATLPNPGDVLYAALKGGGRRAVWGAGGASPPTDPGGGPSVGSPHPLLDANQNNDTVAQTPSRGSLICGNSTPKWDELVKPSVASLLKNDATDAAWVTIPTRKIWLPAEVWVNGSGVPAALGVIGTYPDAYNCWSFDALGTEGIVCNFETPEDWVSGAITFKVRWVSSGATATNWVPYLRYLIRNDGQDMTAANTLITGPTTSANVAIHLLNTTTIGTITPGNPQQEIRLVFERAPGGSDTYLGTIRVLGIRAEFTPAY